MATMLYKYLIVLMFTGFVNSNHPIFVSVTEIEHNTANKTLEISCKIFTDDFEKTLRKQNNTKVDLLNIKVRPAMNGLVNNYIQKHLSIVTDDTSATLEFLGFEPKEEAIVSYYEVSNVAQVKKITVVNTILYEYKSQQMGIIHVSVNGKRKSSRLNNPDDRVSFLF